ncbi:hypothetical protein Pmani_008785 [Petrolisthes manimaculis]|uniref:protein kinase C n=1 Tax=Petrolisthes manimaculis TaxID=1843537 RepID=A0AAE1Q507_9EUCA|nr:hypothetical protein Pmani_008785 [Petrolisthes manimaculis]
MQIDNPEVCRDNTPDVKMRTSGTTYRQRSLSTILMGCVSPSRMEENEAQVVRPKSVYHVKDDNGTRSTGTIILRDKTGRVKREKRSSLTKSLLLLSFKRKVNVKKIEGEEEKHKVLPVKEKFNVDEKSVDNNDEANPGTLYRSVMQPLYCTTNHTTNTSLHNNEDLVQCEVCTDGGMNEGTSQVGLENNNGRVNMSNSNCVEKDKEDNKNDITNGGEQSNIYKYCKEKVTRRKYSEEQNTEMNLNTTQLPPVIPKPVLRQHLRLRSEERPLSWCDVDPRQDKLNYRLKTQPFTDTFKSRPLSCDATPCYSPTTQSVMSSLLYHLTSLSPSSPSLSDTGSIYRRGARRWRKLYKVNGHIFQAKRFNRRAFCEFCKDRIWGLGRQGFKCTQCKLLVHKKCHKLQKVPCQVNLDDTVTTHDTTTSSSGTATLSLPGTNGRVSVTDYTGEIPDPGITEETPVEMPAITGQSSEGATPTGQAGQYCLDDFELIRVIGRGSYAKVLMVELKKTKRIYAMKVIKKTLVTDDEDIDWVQTEKHVFETASNHPFLVGLHSCFQTPSRLFFVIEFVRGGDLMFHMQRQRRLPEEHARFYAAEICLALNFLHEKGIIYRDLKLDNVLLDHEGHIKLTDYGMCKEGIRPGDTTSTFCGTPNYIAPEILQGVEYSFSVDWWALGVLLYEMLAGKSPFDIVGASDNPDCNTEDFLFQVILERPIRIPRSLSVKAASILKGFLNKNPVDRLGCHPETGFTDIINHPFFKTILWDMLEQRQVPPPYRPRLESDRDLANFPPEFTDEPIQLTVDDARAIENIDQSEFEGFDQHHNSGGSGYNNSGMGGGGGNSGGYSSLDDGLGSGMGSGMGGGSGGMSGGMGSSGLSSGMGGGGGGGMGGSGLGSGSLSSSLSGSLRGMGSGLSSGIGSGMSGSGSGLGNSGMGSGSGNFSTSSFNNGYNSNNGYPDQMMGTNYNTF